MQHGRPSGPSAWFGDVYEVDHHADLSVGPDLVV